MRRFLAAASLVLIAASASAASVGEATGIIEAVSGSLVVLKSRAGSISVDAGKAQSDDLSVILYPGEPITVRGSINQNGALIAVSIIRAKPQKALWPIDTLGPARGLQ